MMLESHKISGMIWHVLLEYSIFTYENYFTIEIKQITVDCINYEVFKRHMAMKKMMDHSMLKY